MTVHFSPLKPMLPQLSSRIHQPAFETGGQTIQADSVRFGSQSKPTLREKEVLIGDIFAKLNDAKVKVLKTPTEVVVSQGELIKSEVSINGQQYRARLSMSSQFQSIEKTFTLSNPKSGVEITYSYSDYGDNANSRSGQTITYKKSPKAQPLTIQSANRQTGRLVSNAAHDFFTTKLYELGAFDARKFEVLVDRKSALKSPKSLGLKSLPL